MKKVRELARECDTFISVDSFFPHLARHEGKTGVVVWSVSDPLIFGYPENVNILKDRKYLRKGQFEMWEAQSYSPECFPEPEDVCSAVFGILGGKGERWRTT